MLGRLVIIAILGVSLVSGGLIYYLQEYGFYEEVDVTSFGAVSRSREIVEIPAQDITAIDATTSPIRFRACFTTDLDPADYTPAADPVPLIAPGWFDCFDATEIGEALEAGTAQAILSEPEIRPGADRIIAVFPDGRGFAWHQLNGTLE